MVSKKNVVSNLIWRFAERVGAQAVTLIVSIILARLLSPNEYGVVALIMVVTSILQVFVDSGLGSALVQKKDADELDFSTVFYFNVIFCSVLYFAVFLFAPYIARFYKNLDLIPLIRVSALLIVVSGVKNVQQAYVSRNLMFKRFFFSTLGGTIISAIIGILMAYKGFGCWALICQYLSNAVIDTAILWITVRWRPRKGFSFTRLKSLYSFGWKLLMSTLVDTIYNNLRSLIIGRVFTSEDLAYYKKGGTFPSEIVGALNSSITSILLPVMAKEQDNKDIVKAMTRKAIRSGSYVVWPAMIGLAACAKSFVVLLLSEKWIACVPYMQLFCFSFAMYPIHTANLSAMKAMGRSDIFLKLEIEKKLVGLIIILISVRFGVFAIAIGELVMCPISAVINLSPNKKLINYSIIEQVKDVVPFICMSFFMGIIVYFLQNLPLNVFLVLLIQIIVGVIVYMVESILFRIDVFFELIDILKKILLKNKI